MQGHPYAQGVPPPQQAAPVSGAFIAHAAAAALSNPYAQSHAMYSYSQAPHYAQAYAQYQAAMSGPAVTAEGYTLSSTYTPSSHNHQSFPGPSSRPRQPTARPGGYGQAQAHWYQSGNSRCTRPGCNFVGSQKSVEIHMMDRHLIYPSGWENRKRKSDWDADPSLKG